MRLRYINKRYGVSKRKRMKTFILQHHLTAMWHCLAKVMHMSLTTSNTLITQRIK